MSRLSKGLVVVVLALAVAMAANLAYASQPPKVLEPNSKPYGMDYGQWGAAWWQWVLLSTSNKHPLMDTTGQFAQLNQILSGSVFFLAGTWTGSDPVVRNVTVPKGKAFFFPIYNWVLSYPEDVPLSDSNSEQEAEAWIRKTLNETFDGVNTDELECVVDGVLVSIYRGQSPAFSMYLSPKSYEAKRDHSFITGLPYQEGLHYPTVSDGYWVMLEPLAVGLHTIEIKAGPTGGRWLDITYNLTVVGD